MNDIEKANVEDRYDSQRRYVGEDGQAKIEAAKVAIVGLRGVLPDSAGKDRSRQ